MKIKKLTSLTTDYGWLLQTKLDGSLVLARDTNGFDATDHWLTKLGEKKFSYEFSSVESLKHFRDCLSELISAYEV